MVAVAGGVQRGGEVAARVASAREKVPSIPASAAVRSVMVELSPKCTRQLPRQRARWVGSSAR
jgi:hypothetical protein